MKRLIIIAIITCNLFGADYNKESLIEAIKSGDSYPYDKIKSLIKARVGLNEKDFAGDTPLIWATRKGYVDIVDSLIKAGANINAKNGRQEDALYLAHMYTLVLPYNNYKEIESLLKNAGASLDYKYK